MGLTGAGELRIIWDMRREGREFGNIFMHTLIITGGIATGKSTFGTLIRERLGAAVAFFDCDAGVHELLTRPEVVEKVAASLGDGVLAPDGSLDRRRTSALVFGDPGKRRALEAILHPLVREACWEAGRHAADARIPYFFADVPLYFETGYRWEAELVVLVACAPATQRRRLLARSGDSASHQIDQRLAAQIPILQKIPQADAVVWNGGSLDSLRQQTEFFLSWLKQKLPS